MRNSAASGALYIIGSAILLAACSAGEEPEAVASNRQNLTKAAGGDNGDLDYCASQDCIAGEGDCDRDLDCTGDLVCGTDNGPQFGFGYGWDVCVDALCANGVQDSDETGVDCGSVSQPSDPPCGSCVVCPDYDPGAPNLAFCSGSCPCASGEGDCDSDIDCGTGLVCGADNGKQFGISILGWDVCVDPLCANGVQDSDETGVDCGSVSQPSDPPCGVCACPDYDPGAPDLSFCTGLCPCGAGEGDCDSDAQCELGLVCGTDNGLGFGITIEGWDACVDPLCTNGVQDSDETGVDCGSVSQPSNPPCGACGCPEYDSGALDLAFCKAACPCASGEGDCDVDGQCEGDLVCGSDNGGKFGISIAGWDVCVPAHCVNGTYDPELGETSEDCGGDCGTGC